MKKQLLLLAFTAALGVAQAQNTTSPLYTTNPSPAVDGTTALTVTFDLSQTALGSAAGFSGDIYMYTGIGVLPTATATLLDWQHVRRQWGDVANDAVYKLTVVSTDIYKYTYTNLRSDYGLGADTLISTINYVLRSADGTKQAGDLKVPITQKPSTATGIITVKGNDLALSVSPNPTSDQLNINVSNTGTEKTSLVLVNLVGQTVITKSELEGSTTVSMAGLPSGVYFLKVNVGEKQATKKIVKQ